MNITKRTELQDNQGRQINRKVKFDGKNLYIINKGLKGILKKTVKTQDLGDMLYIRTIRKVAYYI